MVHDARDFYWPETSGPTPVDTDLQYDADEVGNRNGAVQF